MWADNKHVERGGGDKARARLLPSREVNDRRPTARAPATTRTIAGETFHALQHDDMCSRHMAVYANQSDASYRRSSSPRDVLGRSSAGDRP